MMVSVALALAVSGCAKTKNVEAGVPVKVVDTAEDCVDLSSVEPPVFDEVFAMMGINDEWDFLKWGVSSDDSGLIVKESGYPGFGAPMLVETSRVSSGVAIGSEIRLNTKYGMYYYKVSKMFSAVMNQAGTNIVNCNTEKQVIEYGKAGERLYVFFKDHEAVQAELLHGTKIIVSF